MHTPVNEAKTKIRKSVPRSSKKAFRERTNSETRAVAVCYKRLEAVQIRERQYSKIVPISFPMVHQRNSEKRYLCSERAERLEKAARIQRNAQTLRYKVAIGTKSLG